MRRALWLPAALLLAAGPAAASSFMNCEAQGVVLSAAPATPDDPQAPEGWLIEVKVGTGKYVEGMGSPLFGVCWGARKTLTIAYPAEKQPGEKLRILYRTYSANTPNGPMSSETWSIMDGPGIKPGVPDKPL